MRNHHALLGRMAGWLRSDGLLFVHMVAHRTLAFRFDARSRSDWIGRQFFTGGPNDMLPRVADRLAPVDAWRLSGTRYARTARAWLDNLDANSDAWRAVLAEHAGARAAGGSCAAGGCSSCRARACGGTTTATSSW